MKTLYQVLLEKLTIGQYREYAYVKRDERAEAWLAAFWERVKDVPGAEVSKNGHRIYFKFQLPEKDLEYGDQQDTYSSHNESSMLKKEIQDYLLNQGYDVTKFDYIHGTFDYVMKTQRGEKTRTAKVGKALKNAPELMARFAADPVRLTSKLDTKKMMIVLSNHAYDIAGMSTDRKWTSCMDILKGSNKHWVKEDIKWGTVVAYLIEESDKNIENPLGRILIKPYFDENKAIVYFPEPTVYSPYVGLDSMKEFLQDMCNHIANRVSWLYKIARNANDPNQESPKREEIQNGEFDKEDMKVIDDISKKEWAKLEKEENEKYKYLFYYDDYFADNKDYIGMKPGTKRKRGDQTLD